jgi:hypothetical protein
VAKLLTDANGLVTEGKYKGRHIDEVMDYLESLENAANEERPPAPPPAPAPADPPAPPGAARLTAFEGLATATAARLEQDDEADAIATIPDYAEYKPRIDEMKKKWFPAARAQKGVHKQAYIFLKSNEPGAIDKLSGKTPPPPAAPPVDGEELEPGQEAPPPAPPAPPANKEKVGPKAVPPPASARPTPSGRSGAPAARTPKLKDTHGKLSRMAAAFGKGLDQYLIELEDAGMTQESIDLNSLPRTAGGVRRTARVFDNA